MPLALVIGRNYTTRLALTRAMGMAGCKVVLIQTDKKKSHVQKIDRCCKFVKEWHCCPEPNKQMLIDTIRQYEGNGEKGILIPADDYVAAVIDENLEILQEHFMVPHVNNIQGEVLKIMDKGYQKTIAEKTGMRVARGWVCQYKNGEYDIPDDIIYPCFVKPKESYDGALKHLQKRCDTKSELELILQRAAKKYQLPLLAEEYIQIEKEYAVLGVSLGDHAFIPAVIHMNIGRKGLTATGRIFPISELPGLEKSLCFFMKEINFTGLFDIDIYESKGCIYFNELNTRFGASGFALIYGVNNLPDLYIQYMLGKKDVSYRGPIEFKSLNFASEKVLRDMYYDGTISFKDYKKTMKNADILSLKYEGDMGPYRQFAKLDRILPLWRQLRVLKKKLHS